VAAEYKMVAGRRERPSDQAREVNHASRHDPAELDLERAMAANAASDRPTASADALPALEIHARRPLPDARSRHSRQAPMPGVP